MTEEERLATETCNKFLTAAQLKAVCRYRGFSSLGGGKDELAAFVAVRLLEPTGVAEAMASLEPLFLVVLHRVAMAGEPVTVGALGRVLDPGRRAYGNHDPRDHFRKLGDGLLNRGVVLLGDVGTPCSGESRYSCVGLTLPAAHRPRLPPFPGDAQLLGSHTTGGEPIDVIRGALRLVASGTAPSTGAGSTDLAVDLARELSLTDRGIMLSGAPASTERLLRRTRELWVERSAPTESGNKRGGAPTQEALSAATHVLAHAAEGHGFSPVALGGCLDRLGLDATQGSLSRFCEDGVATGMLVRGGTVRAPCYAAREAPASDMDEPLVFDVDKGGITIDIDRSGLTPLLALARASEVTGKAGTLRLVPSVRRLGREWESASRALAEVRSRSSAFDKAAREVERLQGKVTVHTGIVVARIEDVGLRALLLMKLGSQVRELGGPYLAIPKAAVAPMLDVARKEGFVPRRVS